MLRNSDGGVRFFRKKYFEGVRFNVISVTRGWVEVQFPEKSVTELIVQSLATFFVGGPDGMSRNRQRATRVLY